MSDCTPCIPCPGPPNPSITIYRVSSSITINPITVRDRGLEDRNEVMVRQKRGEMRRGEIRRGGMRKEEERN